MIDTNSSDSLTLDVTYAELARGTAAGKGPAADLLASGVEKITVEPFDDRAARLYAGLPFARHRFDRLIAAHALALDVTLVTANPKDFRDIRGLRVEDWTK